MNQGMKALIALVVAGLALNLAMIGFFSWERFGPQKQNHPAQVHLSRAGLYSANGLWKSAAEEYQKAADFETGAKAANLWLQAGDICYEKLDDYSCAAESYLNAKILGKEFGKDSDLATRLVDSLRCLGKTESANALLNELTALVPETAAGGTVAARIGERTITLEDLRKALAAEPEVVQKNFAGKEGLRKYLEQYIYTNFLYQAALEENLLDDSSAAGYERMKERYLAELYFQKKILDPLKATDKEIRDYYDQNSSEFKDSSGKVKSFDSARAEADEKFKEKKLAQARDEWFKEQAQKRGLFVNAQAFGSQE